MDRFETDVMDDLMYEAAEGPASAMESFEGGDDLMEGFEAYDEADEADEADDEFLGRLIGGIGRVAGGLLGGGGGDGFDEYDELDEADAYDAAAEFDAGDDGEGFAEDLDAMEEAVADAMEAVDGDEFFRRLGRIARTVGRGVGSVARVVAPIASMIPLPQAQLIGRIANVAGRLLADGADDFEAFDEFVEALDEEALDAAAPVLAGMVIRRALPNVARAPRPVRRAAVREVTRAVRTVARRQGPRAARAVARAVRATRRIAQRRRLAPRQTVQAVRTVVRRVVQRPQVVRRLAAPLVASARRVTPRGQGARVVARAVLPVARRVVASTVQAAPLRRIGIAAGSCPSCRGRTVVARGPVVINLRCR